MHVILHVIVCNAVCNEWCNAVCNESYYIAYYMPLHEILHACYMTLKIWVVLHVMACNWHVITCHYMHYMPLHAIEDANANLKRINGWIPTTGSRTPSHVCPAHRSSNTFQRDPRAARTMPLSHSGSDSEPPRLRVSLSQWLGGGSGPVDSRLGAARSMAT